MKNIKYSAEAGPLPSYDSVSWVIILKWMSCCGFLMSKILAYIVFCPQQWRTLCSSLWLVRGVAFKVWSSYSCTCRWSGFCFRHSRCYRTQQSSSGGQVDEIRLQRTESFRLVVVQRCDDDNRTWILWVLFSRKTPAERKYFMFDVAALFIS